VRSSIPVFLTPPELGVIVVLAANQSHSGIVCRYNLLIKFLQLGALNSGLGAVTTWFLFQAASLWWLRRRLCPHSGPMRSMEQSEAMWRVAQFVVVTLADVLFAP
jgi:hypothetical protein